MIGAKLFQPMAQGLSVVSRFARRCTNPDQRTQGGTKNCDEEQATRVGVMGSGCAQTGHAIMVRNGEREFNLKGVVPKAQVPVRALTWWKV
jgi:hypothetical protein